jgi:hypothetical protein
VIGQFLNKITKSLDNQHIHIFILQRRASLQILSDLYGVFIERAFQLLVEHGVIIVDVVDIRRIQIHAALRESEENG